MRFHLLLCVALIFAAQARTEDLVLKIAPVNTSFDVKGQAVKITAWGAVSSGPQQQFKLALTADLSDLQDNLGALLASQLNRSDRCGERLSVERATLVPASPAAVLTAHVHYERWACVKAFGREVVKRLVGGNAVLTVKLTPSAGADGISMAAEVQKIEADGSLGELLRSGSLGTTVKEKIASSIESSIRKGLDLKSTLPPAVAAAATLRAAQFVSGAEGKLWISVDGEVHFSPAQFQSLNLKKYLGAVLQACARSPDPAVSRAERGFDILRGMAHIQTVRGPLDTAQLGVTLMHEHVFVLSTEILQNYPDIWGDEEQRVADAAARLNELYQLGVRSIVDLTVIGLGRYIPRIQRVAALTPLHIVVATGVYTYNDLPFHFHHQGPGTILDGPEPMVEMFVRDIEEGIAGTGVRDRKSVV